MSEAAPGKLPVPPEELWLGYGPDAEAYISSGKRHVSEMSRILGENGFALTDTKRILEFGCGAGRMIRHLPELAPQTQLWGVDVSAEHVRWCIENLTPFIHFATTTLVPHLPFADEFFDLIYGGSVFTHIEDIQETWLLELARVLRPGGRLYVTIHDEDTVSRLDGDHKHGKLAKMMSEQPVYVANKHKFNMIVLWRGSGSQVFYRSDYFRAIVPPVFRWISRTPGAYDYQSAVVLEKN
jgi:ubiquinone/menaquinone biosynthesis C-methylase UbiE